MTKNNQRLIKKILLYEIDPNPSTFNQLKTETLEWSYVRDKLNHYNGIITSYVYNLKNKTNIHFYN